MSDVNELQYRAHKITITYSFDEDGGEWVTVDSDDDMSNLLLLGILELTKNRILNPELYEDEEDEETYDDT